MQLSLPRRFDSTLSPSMIVPRCGSTLQLIVADLCGRRRYHTFSASATLKSFQHALALYVFSTTIGGVNAWKRA